MIRIAACLSAALLLGACQNSTPPPAARDVPGLPPAYHVAGPVDLMLPASGGVSLPTRIWHAGWGQRGVILALHGFNDSRDGWELAGPVFAHAGFTVYAPDQRGFGAAPDRGRWPGTATLLADARAMAAAIHAREPDMPLYIMGESMGGAEAQLLAADPPPGVAGFVALAPGVWTAGQMGPGLTVPLALANAFAPGWQPNAGSFHIHRAISDNCNALLRLSADPLSLHGARADTLHGLVGLMTQAAAAARRVRAPLLVAYGAHDDLVPPEALRAEWAALPDWVRRAYYPGGYHLLQSDLGRRQVIDDVISWITTPNAALPSGADVTASTFETVSAGQDASPPIWGRLDNLAGGSRKPHYERCTYTPEP